MLEDLPTQRGQRCVFRLANVPNINEFLAELGLDTQSADELRALLVARGHVLSDGELCDGPFRRKRKFRGPTRFSDGSFPVFYSSLDLTTAEAEVRHWFPQFSGQPNGSRTGYYQRFSCQFDGIEIDLRPKIDQWPDLVHDTDYTFCNQLGAEAERSEVDAFLTWSARHKGTNVPIFRRDAIGNPIREGVVAFTYDPDSGEVTTSDLTDAS